MCSSSAPTVSASIFALISSSVTMLLSWAALKMGNLGRGRAWMLATMGLAAVFLAVKVFEYRAHILAGEIPARGNFFAIYYTLTGLHGLHVLGGIVVMAYLAGPGAGMWARGAERYTNRVETVGVYWHFVDLVWIFLFPAVYLL